MRSVCFELLEEIESDKSLPLVARTRSLAAIASSLSLSSQIIRKSLQISKHEDAIQPKKVESFVIRCMSEAEEEELRARVNDPDYFATMRGDDGLFAEAKVNVSDG